MELRLTSRRAENLLVTLVIPVALLVFFGSVDVLPTGTGRPIDFLLPGVAALAVISTSLVSLGIATGYERAYGVLKRLGGSPWAPGAGASAFVVAVALLLGTLAFAGLGLLMAGTLRAEATLASANGLYLLLLLLGGVIVPLDRLPQPVADLAGVLPAAALSDAFRIGLGTMAGDPTAAVALLAAWGVVLAGLAARMFRWE